MGLLERHTESRGGMANLRTLRQIKVNNCCYSSVSDSIPIQMNGTKKRKVEQFKLKKPVKIQYASAQDVAKVTQESLRVHALVIEWLAKT
jgi:hypothetical protein